MKEEYNIDPKELYKQKKQDILNNSKHYVLFEIILEEGSGLLDVNTETANIEQIATFYKMLKDQIRDIEDEFPEIKEISKLVNTEEIEFDY